MNTSLLRTTALSLFAASGLSAQELPMFGADPSMDLVERVDGVLKAGESRLQQLFEFDTTAPTTVQFETIEFRFDGPSASSAVLASIDEMSLYVGVTTRSVDQATAVFADNLDAPLSLFVQKSNQFLVGDLAAQSDAELWGGLFGELRFTADSVQSLTIPPGGSLVLELVVESGNLPVPAQFLDFDDDGLGTDPIRAGIEVREGSGCIGPQGAPVTLDVFGDFAPGGSLRTGGLGYAAETPVFVFLGPNLVLPRMTLPGTPNCWTDLDFTTSGLLETAITGPDGSFDPMERPPLPIPRIPALSGQLLYLQAASPVPVSPQNSLGVVTSNYRTITVGNPGPSRTRGYFVQNRSDRNAIAGESARPGSLAVRLR